MPVKPLTAGNPLPPKAKPLPDECCLRCTHWVKKNKMLYWGVCSNAQMHSCIMVNGKAPRVYDTLDSYCCKFFAVEPIGE